MPEGLRKPEEEEEEEEVLPWEFVLVLWAGVTEDEEEEFSKAIGIFLEQIREPRQIPGMSPQNLWGRRRRVWPEAIRLQWETSQPGFLFCNRDILLKRN